MARKSRDRTPWFTDIGNSPSASRRAAEAMSIPVTTRARETRAFTTDPGSSCSPTLGAEDATRPLSHQLPDRVDSPGSALATSWGQNAPYWSGVERQFYDGFETSCDGPGA